MATEPSHAEELRLWNRAVVLHAALGPMSSGDVDFAMFPNIQACSDTSLPSDARDYACETLRQYAKIFAHCEFLRIQRDAPLNAAACEDRGRMFGLALLRAEALSFGPDKPRQFGPL